MAKAGTKMILCSVRVGRHQIGYLKWLLESHDGMATPTTREGSKDIVDLLISPDFVQEVEELLDALVEEIDLQRVPPPNEQPLGG
jgi:hypothetical protein